VIDNTELAEYILNEMKGCTIKGANIDGKWLYVKQPFASELAFWIQQFKTKDCYGHSEWSERYHKNIWIKDKET